MDSEVLSRAWFKQVQIEAEQGVITCRMCHRRSDLDQTTTLWRGGLLVFALCDLCAASHDLWMRPQQSGVEIRARRRAALVLGKLG